MPDNPNKNYNDFLNSGAPLDRGFESYGVGLAEVGAVPLGHPEGSRISGEYDITLKSAADINNWAGQGINTERTADPHGTPTFPILSKMAAEMQAHVNPPALQPTATNPNEIVWFQRDKKTQKIMKCVADARERMFRANCDNNSTGYLTVLTTVATEADFLKYAKQYENFCFSEKKVGKYTPNSLRAERNGDV